MSSEYSQHFRAVPTLRRFHRPKHRPKRHRRACHWSLGARRNRLRSTGQLAESASTAQPRDSLYGVERDQPIVVQSPPNRSHHDVSWRPSRGSVPRPMSNWSVTGCDVRVNKEGAELGDWLSVQSGKKNEKAWGHIVAIFLPCKINVDLTQSTNLQHIPAQLLRRCHGAVLDANPSPRVFGGGSRLGVLGSPTRKLLLQSSTPPQFVAKA